MSSGCDSHRHNPADGEDSFAALDNGRKLALWGIRVWVAALRNNWPPAQTRETLREGFALAYALEAIDPLEGMMSILAGGSSRQIAVNCPRCPGSPRMSGFCSTSSHCASSAAAPAVIWTARTGSGGWLAA